MIERIHEVGPEQEPESLGYGEALFRRHIEIHQARTPHRTHTAGAELMRQRRAVGVRINPLVTAAGIPLFAEYAGGSGAVGTRSAGVRPGGVAARDGERKTAVPREDAAGLPAVRGKEGVRGGTPKQSLQRGRRIR